MVGISYSLAFRLVPRPGALLLSLLLPLLHTSLTALRVFVRTMAILECILWSSRRIIHLIFHVEGLSADAKWTSLVQAKIKHEGTGWATDAKHAGREITGLAPEKALADFSKGLPPACNLMQSTKR
jgi:hypothetical protein